MCVYVCMYMYVFRLMYACSCMYVVVCVYACMCLDVCGEITALKIQTKILEEKMDGRSEGKQEEEMKRQSTKEWGSNRVVVMQ